MKRIFPLASVAAFIAMLFSANTAAQTPQQSIQTETKVGAPAMWRVADEDSEFFLFGTFHFLKPETVWRNPAMEEAWARAEAAYFEVEADAPQNQSIAVNTVMTKGFNPPGQLLTNMLETQDAQKLREVVASLGLPLAGVDPMRPWNAFLTISVQFITSKGFDPGAGADSVLLAEARALGKELVFLKRCKNSFRSLPISPRKQKKTYWSSHYAIGMNKKPPSMNSLQRG